jgi:ABC-type multidrug transport system fused ATPase/permease subunit
MLHTLKKTWWLLTRGEKKTFAWLTFLTVLSATLEMVSLAIVIPATSVLIDSNSVLPSSPLTSEFNALSSTSRVVIGMTALTAIFVLKNLYNAIIKAKQFAFQSKIEVRVSDKLLNKYLRQPFQFHLKTNSSDMYRNLLEIGQLIDTTIAPALLLVCETIVIVGIAALLLFVEPRGFLAVVAVFSLFSVFFSRWSNKSAKHYGQDRRDALGNRLKVLHDCFNGVKEIQIYGRETVFLKRFSSENSKYAIASQKFLYLKFLPTYFLEIIVVGALGLLATILAISAKSPTETITTLAVFGAAAFRILPSLNRTINAVQALRFGSPTLDGVIEGLELIERKEPIESKKMEFENSIEFRNVGFRYGNQNAETIKNVSFKISKDTAIGIIGESGAGKSTIIDLLLGLHTPTSGSIEVDGIDIATNLPGWRENIGYVPQNVFISDTTIKENIAFGLTAQNIDQEKLASAIRRAQLEDFLSKQEDGINARVGEHGLEISGGERQRIGIARALYGNPKVLVLDEPTSALDSGTEDDFLREIEELKKSITVIVVTHRMRIIKNCEKILSISEGRIESEGNYSEIISLTKELLDG